MKRPIITLLLLALSTTADVCAQEESGANLFDNRCGLCHRGNGTGTFMLERRLGKAQAILEERNDLNDTYVQTVVRTGVGSMPRFSRGEITDEELDRIVAYLIKKDR